MLLCSCHTPIAIRLLHEEDVSGLDAKVNKVNVRKSHSLRNADSWTQVRHDSARWTAPVCQSQGIRHKAPQTLCVGKSVVAKVVHVR